MWHSQLSLFKELNLSITMDVSAKVVNFLDITLDLSKGIHKPYMKPGNTPLYINRKSNHPPLIIKNIPDAITEGSAVFPAMRRYSTKPYQHTRTL